LQDEGWSSASSDRRAERSLKRVKGRARKGIGGSNGAHVHITVSMALTVFVELDGGRGRSGKW
jgi:hypothetical protein